MHRSAADAGNTYISLTRGVSFLTVTLDVCNRKVVGYAISRQIDMELTLAALKAAIQSSSSAAHTAYAIPVADVSTAVPGIASH